MFAVKLCLHRWEIINRSREQDWESYIGVRSYRVGVKSTGNHKVAIDPSFVDSNR